MAGVPIGADRGPLLVIVRVEGSGPSWTPIRGPSSTPIHTYDRRMTVLEAAHEINAVAAIAANQAERNAEETRLAVLGQKAPASEHHLAGPAGMDRPRRQYGSPLRASEPNRERTNHRPL